MKYIATFLLFLSTSVYAQWFPVNAFVVVNPFVVKASVYNNSFRPLVCRGQAVGFTYYGQQLWSGLEQVWIYPGSSAFFYVYTNNFNPFVAGDARVFCIWR